MSKGGAPKKRPTKVKRPTLAQLGAKLDQTLVVVDELTIQLAAATARAVSDAEIIGTYQSMIKTLNDALKTMAARPAPQPIGFTGPIGPSSPMPIHPGATMAAFAAQMDEPEADPDNPPVEGAITISGFQERLHEMWNGGDHPKPEYFVPGTALDDTPQAPKETDET